MRDIPWGGAPGNGRLQGIQRAEGLWPSVFLFTAVTFCCVAVYHYITTMIPYLISIDWLQISGRLHDAVPTSAEIHKYKEHDPFIDHVDLTESTIYNPIFAERRDIKANGVVVAQIFWAPRTSSLDRNLCSVRLDNRTLYCQDRIKILYQICAALHVEICGITRLDLCYDCNKLANGWDPANFVYKYVCNKPLRKGHIHRSGSTRFSCNGTRKWNQHSKITSIRFGSPKSDIGAYIYNKTLELAEVKDKPWIRECWEKAGLISELSDELAELSEKDRAKMVDQHTLAGYCVRSVWRFEISIRCEGRDLLRVADSGLFKLSVSDAENQADIEELFYIYAQKAFDFRLNTGQKNIRHYKPMQLFVHGDVPCNYRPVHVSRLLDSGRTEKMCANKLDKILRTYVDMPNDLQQAVARTINYLLMVSGRKKDAMEAMDYARYLDRLMGSTFYRKQVQDAVKISMADQINRAIASALMEYAVKTDNNKSTMEDFIGYSESNSGPLAPSDRKNTPAEPEEDTHLVDDCITY